MRVRSRLAIFGVTALVLVSACRGHQEASDDASLTARAGTRSRVRPTVHPGFNHTCLKTRREVRCWGSGEAVNGMPALANPHLIDLGAAHSCVLDDDGVKCWGRNLDRQTAVPAGLRSPRQIATGYFFSCALDDDGVKCWGDNAHKQTNVPPLRNPRELSAGGNHACALDDDGVKCWGNDDDGQTKVPPLRRPRHVSAGGYHTCALDDDGVKCWGKSSNGQTTVPPLRGTKLVSAGGFHTCALDDEGLECWGRTTEGQLTFPRLERVESGGAGFNHTCTIDDDGVKCWGSNTLWQAYVPSDLELTGHHTCFATEAGARCVGDNESGQIGIESDVDRALATADASASDLGRSFGVPTTIAHGRDFACAVNEAGVAKCWGSNTYGQLGVGDTRDRGLDPGDMGDALASPKVGVPVALLDAGARHACALTRDSALYCWGSGGSGRLGSEATSDVVEPVRVRLASNLRVKGLALGSLHTCVLGDSGAVYCFGRNDSGQLGTGRSGAVGDRPETMGDAMLAVDLGAGFEAKAIASGDRHACALSTKGRVKCWGANERGQLGLGDTRARGATAGDMGDALPTLDLGVGQVVEDIACGARHCCARMLQGTMKCWGDNTKGELGLGDVTPRGREPDTTGDALAFVALPPRERVRAIVLHGEHTCARTESGLRCWGRNLSAELGYGDRAARGTTPATIPRLLAPLGI